MTEKETSGDRNPLEGLPAARKAAAEGDYEKLKQVLEEHPWLDKAIDEIASFAKQVDGIENAKDATAENLTRWRL